MMGSMSAGVPNTCTGMIAATRRPVSTVDGHPVNRGALLRKEATDTVDVDAAVLVAVDEHGEGARVAHRVHGRDERHGRHDDFVVRPHARENEGDVKR